MPKNDYVKREDIFQAVTEIAKEIVFGNQDDDKVVDIINSIPAADVAEVRHGRWKGPRYRFGSDELECTKCGHLIKVRAGSELPNYSDSCGAKMDEDKGGRRTMKIKLDPGAKMPTRAHPTDAGLDLYAAEDVEIYPAGTRMRDGKTGMFFPYPCGKTIDTGVHIALDSGTSGKIESRSGLNINAHVVSCGGVIDEGYTESIKVKLYNFGSDRYRIMKGDKIAQLVIMLYLTPELEIVDELEQTERGDAGFGSTGK